MIRVGILGAKGYAAAEALRWLVGHPEVELTALMGRVEAPEPIAKYSPQLRDLVDLPVTPIDVKALVAQCDAVFLALPHTTAQEYGAELLRAGVKAIDISADFRFDSVPTYEATYGVKHQAPELNAKFVYALPELFGEQIPGAAGLACPGCYPTGALLGLAPLMRRPESFDLDRIVVNALSGISGAGRKLEETYLFSERNESLRAYGIGDHRHRPEIEEKLTALAGRAINFTFIPHLVPITRGILSTITVPLSQGLKTAAAHEIYREFYADRPFVRLLPPGETPATGDVLRTNFCDIGVEVDSGSGALVVVSAIDNLAKGASSQAIQAMNLLFGLPETLGLLPGSTRKTHV